MSFPRWDPIVVKRQDYLECLFLFHGYGHPRLRALGLNVSDIDHRIVNFDEFICFFRDPDVRHVTIFRKSGEKIGQVFLQENTVFITQFMVDW